MSLQCVDNIYGRNSFTFIVLVENQDILNDFLQKGFENSTHFFIDISGNTHDAPMTSHSTNSRL